MIFNFLVWAAVTSLLTTPRMVYIEIHSVPVAEAASPASEVGSEAIKAMQVTEEADSTPTPQGQPDIEEMIRKEFGTDADDMLKIAMCESNLDPNALGDENLTYEENGKQYGTSHGIFQIRHLPGRPEPLQLNNADFNIRYAKTVLDSQGKYAWSWCYRHAVLNKI